MPAMSEPDSDATPSAVSNASATLFSGSPKPVKVWPGLFELYDNGDGTRRVELTPELSMRQQMLAWKIAPGDTPAFRFAVTLLGIGPLIDLEIPEIPEPKLAMFGGSNIVEIRSVALKIRGYAEVWKRLLTSINEGCEPMLAQITTGPESERPQATKALKERLCDCVDAMALRISRPAHGNAASITVTLENGKRIDAALPWLAIEVARQLVAETGELPTKLQVRHHIEQRYEKARSLSGKTWTDAWTEAGLHDLPHEKPKTRRHGVRVDSKVRD
jgi:hypothetical protein